MLSFLKCESGILIRYLANPESFKNKIIVKGSRETFTFGCFFLYQISLHLNDQEPEIENHLKGISGFCRSRCFDGICTYDRNKLLSVKVVCSCFSYKGRFLSGLPGPKKLNGQFWS
jgi:hypothetical protein